MRWGLWDAKGAPTCAEAPSVVHMGGLHRRGGPFGHNRNQMRTIFT